MPESEVLQAIDKEFLRARLEDVGLKQVTGGPATVSLSAFLGFDTVIQWWVFVPGVGWLSRTVTPDFMMIWAPAISLAQTVSVSWRDTTIAAWWLQQRKV